MREYMEGPPPEMMEGPPIDWEVEAEEQASAPDIQVQLRNYIDLLEQYDDEIIDLESRLKDVVKKRDMLSSQTIPELFHQCGVTEMKLNNGKKVSIAKKYHASITEAKRREAYKQLEALGYGNKVKTKISLEFGKGDEDSVKAAEKVLSEAEFVFATREDIHAGSLKAIVKEQCERLENMTPEQIEAEAKEGKVMFDRDLFGTFVREETKIK